MMLKFQNIIIFKKFNSFTCHCESMITSTANKNNLFVSEIL